MAVFTLLGIWLNAVAVVSVGEDISASRCLLRGFQLYPTYLGLWVLSNGCVVASGAAVFLSGWWLTRWRTESAAEMTRLVTLLGGRPENVTGLPGVGDQYVTCMGGRTVRLGRLLGKSQKVVQAMKTEEKRQFLMNHRKEQLSQLIRAYYHERGWTTSGIPTADILKQVGLWPFLNEAAKTKIIELTD